MVAGISQKLTIECHHLKIEHTCGHLCSATQQQNGILVPSHHANILTVALIDFICLILIYDMSNMENGGII